MAGISMRDFPVASASASRHFDAEVHLPYGAGSGRTMFRFRSSSFTGERDRCVATQAIWTPVPCRVNTINRIRALAHVGYRLRHTGYHAIFNGDVSAQSPAAQRLASGSLLRCNQHSFRRISG